MAHGEEQGDQVNNENRTCTHCGHPDNEHAFCTEYGGFAEYVCFGDNGACDCVSPQYAEDADDGSIVRALNNYMDAEIVRKWHKR